MEEISNANTKQAFSYLKKLSENLGKDLWKIVKQQLFWGLIQICFIPHLLWCVCEVFCKKAAVLVEMSEVLQIDSHRIKRQKSFLWLTAQE